MVNVSNWTTTLIRSWTLLWLIGWQGGFVFYSGVVVPIGARVIGSELEQGLVTQAVTHWLNGIGAVALLSWSFAFAATPAEPTRGWRWTSLAIWGAMTVGWGALLMLHFQMDELIDESTRSVQETAPFYLRHRIYLIISTAQWLGCLVLVPLTLRGWQRGDRKAWLRDNPGVSPMACGG